MGGIETLSRSPSATQVSSSRRSRPSSIIISSSCSTKSGFPPRRPRSVRALPRRPEPGRVRCSITRPDFALGERLERDRHRPDLLTPVSPEFEELRTGEADEEHRPLGLLCQVLDELEEGRSPPSGRPRRRARAGCRRRSPRAACGRPRTPRQRRTGRQRARWRRRRARPRLQPRPPRGRASLRTATSCVSSSEMAAAWRTASRRGQKVIPRPYARQRPRRSRTRLRRASPRARRAGATFRLPRRPRTVTSRQRWSSRLARAPRGALPSSASLPTSGAEPLRVAPSERIRPRSR